MPQGHQPTGDESATLGLMNQSTVLSGQTMGNKGNLAYLTRRQIQMEQKHVQRLQQSKIRDLERQVEL